MFKGVNTQRKDQQSSYYRFQMLIHLTSDLRNDTTTPLAFTKSINLALSQRGITALSRAQCPNLVESILSETIPMHGRMIHSRSAGGTLTSESQLYDAQGRFIRAADRAELNKSLLNQLASFSNVKLFFNHKLTGADFDNGHAWIENKSVMHTDAGGKQRPEEIEISFDFMIGADGAHSAVRFHMMKFARVSYKQEYIDTLWCEFHIPPKLLPDGKTEFAINPNRLHIWPSPGGSRDPMMFIAIPSSDKSFTCTLFAPPYVFEQHSLKPEASELVHFFQQNFPGVTPELIKPEDIAQQFQQNPHLPLISIKCNPHHYAATKAQLGAVILGDAAHAMVPFYGQGMNAGLEDVNALFQCFDEATTSHSFSGSEIRTDLQAVLERYTSFRKPASHAIVDLSMRNFEEMREGVTSPLYLARKKVEEWLSVRVPWSGFATQYARVSFSDERYDKVIQSVDWQRRVLERSAGAMGALVGLGAMAWGVRLISRGR